MHDLSSAIGLYHISYAVFQVFYRHLGLPGNAPTPLSASGRAAGHLFGFYFETINRVEEALRKNTAHKNNGAYFLTIQTVLLTKRW